MKVIYLAAGCFWATEKIFSEVDGVESAVSGYANGKEDITEPSYELVCTGLTGYRETVKVTFDETKVSLKKLLLIFFNIIDPTVYDRQGADVGPQYQAGIYYTTDDQLDVIEETSQIVKDTAPAFCVEIKPFERFYNAEEYHQKYLEKNPNGYCHISRAKIVDLPGRSEDELTEILKERQYFI